MAPATLYVVATPLGHLGDLTERAREILRTVPVVAAEDTRRTQGLLAHIGARPRLLSFHAHSPARRTESLLEILQQGEAVALVTDAGTPAISDPGADLVAEVRAKGWPVVPIPGVSAVAAALSVAGLPADRFLFLGFIPRKGKERERLLRAVADSEWTVVLYEAPQRLEALIEDLARVAGGERRVLIARELTKLHEETWLGSLQEAVSRNSAEPPRGELTIVVEGRSERPEQPSVSRKDAEGLAREFLAMGLTRKEAARRLTEEAALARNEAYRIVMELE